MCSHRYSVLMLRMKEAFTNVLALLYATYHHTSLLFGASLKEHHSLTLASGQIVKKSVFEASEIILNDW